MEFDPCEQADAVLRQQLNKMRQEVMQESCDDLGQKLLKNEHFYWTTKDGRKLFIADMADEHLVNCLKALAKRNASNPFIGYELARRTHFKKGGNNAQD